MPTLLIDADVYGGVTASAFGLLDESPGLAGACRLAANGRLDMGSLTALCWSLGDDLRLLTGIARADRWPEVRPSAIPGVLGVAREMAPLTIVDCGFAIEADEEISFDTMAPRRNGATLAVLADADVLLAVGSCDPAGLERLIRGLAELAEALPEAAPRVMLNRCRPSVGSTDEAEAALDRFAGVRVVSRLPEDRAATDRAWRRGVSLAEAAPRSPLRTAIREYARTLLPAAERASA
jgi:Flp pilus assembly CpaE family ATPase